MTTRVAVVLLAVLSALQLGAAAWSIARYESTLASGALYRIRTAAVDPADAFRGRYVAVQPSITLAEPIAAETRDLLDSSPGDRRRIYVGLAAGADGFATAAQILTEPPASGDYLEIEQAWPQWDQRTPAGGEPRRIGYMLTFSFDRYYMNETAAPAAERKYFDAQGPDSASRAWVTVRVKDGLGVIENLYVNGVPIEQAVAPQAR
jgi:uncharacterized membrane-anchored protein